MKYRRELNYSIVEKISRYLEPFECAVVGKFPDRIESMGDGVYSKIREYAECEDYKNSGFVPQTCRQDWDRKLYAVALKLRYAVAIGDNCYVFVNTSCKPDFFKNVQKLAKAFNQESVIVKEACSQDAYRAGVSSDAVPRESVGPFMDNIPLAEILQRAFGPLGMPLNFKDEDLQKMTCIDTWAGYNNMGKYMISQIAQKIMEELGIEPSTAQKNA